MQLLSASDHEQAIFEGPGYIDVNSPTSMQFTLFTKDPVAAESIRRLTALQEDPYDIQKHLRLRAVDYDGTDWSCGWTTPRLKGLPKSGFPLIGRLDSLVTLATGHWVAEDSSVELIFHPRLDLPMSSSMVTVTSVEGEELEKRISPGRHKMHLLGSEIQFFYPPAEDVLWLTATTSPQLPHPYCENWLSEPLSILLGSLVHPRLVARNLGNGTAQVWVRPSPPRTSDWGLAALLEQHPFGSNDVWRLYAALLTHIASAKNSKGDPEFEPNALTRYYQEAILATKGSRWVLCMTLASSIEGLVRMLSSKPRGDLAVETYLKKLERAAVISSKHRIAWRNVRHAVMHGQLVSPWSTREEDGRIHDLIDLLRRLTHELLRSTSASAGAP